MLRMRPRKRPDDLGGHELQVPGEEDHVDVLTLEEPEQLGAHLGRLASARGDDGRPHAGPLGARERARVGSVGHEQHDLPGPGGTPMIEQGLKVGAAPGREDGRSQRHASSPP